jgi:hypothetical protein
LGDSTCYVLSRCRFIRINVCLRLCGFCDRCFPVALSQRTNLAAKSHEVRRAKPTTPAPNLVKITMGEDVDCVSIGRISPTLARNNSGMRPHGGVRKRFRWPETRAFINRVQNTRLSCFVSRLSESVGFLKLRVEIKDQTLGHQQEITPWRTSVSYPSIFAPQSRVYSRSKARVLGCACGSVSSCVHRASSI